MKSLYAYFGLLDLHNIDSPGHSLYQLGLVDSIGTHFGESKFDFYSYYPEEVIKSCKLSGFPESELGQVFHKYRKKLFENPIHNIGTLLESIAKKEYSKLFLKARFRNLSTLAKKWKDAREFEEIIEAAFRAGYTKDEIFILDTDLSLPDSFYEKYFNKVTVVIPSIDFPGISLDFLQDCVNANHSEKDYSNFSSVFYGNIDTSKYKSGNDKSEILGSVVTMLDSLHNIRENNANPFYLICKENDFNSIFKVGDNTKHVPRNERSQIWDTLEASLIMVNVTKEKYNEVKFIPARIYEAMIFGMIPISYKFDFLCKAFSFETIEDFIEIYKYLLECTAKERDQAYLHFVASYLNHTNK
jgi:hypothetical protein